MADTTTIYVNNLFNLLLNKITIPTEYHSQVKAVKEMLGDDLSGLADSLTDFQVNSADVDFRIETNNAELTRKLNNWLEYINAPYNGQIPRGIKALAEEYYKERWKNSSFPILKILDWGNYGGIIVPTKMSFVDGGSIYSEEKDKSNVQKLLNYNYYLGRDKGKGAELNTGVIITKPYGRWFDEYPTPYLIKRGVYHNYLIIKALKSKQTDLLEKIIPYLLLIKKGSETLEREGKTVNTQELKDLVSDFRGLIDQLSEKVHRARTPVRATQWDEDITHLVPDMIKLFEPNLFAVAERNVLSGLGFIDVVEATSTSRRESILNPKAFIEETKKGVKDFRNNILQELIYRIKEENKDDHNKYFTDDRIIKVTNSPVVGFLTDQFKQEIRLQWKNGILSNQTYCELVGEVEYATEVARRERETRDGEEILMYPHQTNNIEDKESFEEMKRQQEYYDEEPTPKDEEKRPDNEDKDKFNKSAKKDLITAPYDTIKQLPKAVRNNVAPNLQKVWMDVFNRYYPKYGDARSARIAWGVIKKIGKRNKQGLWVKKSFFVKASEEIIIETENEEK